MQVASAVERNGRRIVRMLLLPAMLFMLVGCVEIPTAAWEELSEARRDYDKRAYRVASGKVDIALREHVHRGGSADTVPRGAEAFAAEAYYLRSLCGTKTFKKVRAEADAKQCLKLSKDAALTARAHANLATLLYEANRIREALPHFAEALKGLPDRPPTDLMRYRYGLSLQRENRWKEARVQFAAVFQHYPTGTSAQHAKRLYEWPHDFYSIQCGAFRDKSKAAKLERKLKRAGLRSKVETRPRSGELLYVVYVGRYPRYNGARDSLRSVQRVVSDALVVPQ